MMSLREVRQLLRQYNIRPSKRLGQNFLIDGNVQRKIMDAVGLDREDVALEIGPGLGALTEGLCKRARKVVAVEKDKRLCEILSKKRNPANLELVHGDILKYDLSKYSNLKVVGNLPYYISSPVLVRLLEARASVKVAYITVQREFAERLVAQPGTKVYGSISCFTQFYAEPEILFSIKKGSFYPAPKIDSCFLMLVFRDRGLYLTDEEKLFKIIRTCFEKRRKTILNSLYSSGLFGSKEEVASNLKKAGISQSRRPETVSLKEFTDLANLTLV